MAKFASEHLVGIQNSSRDTRRPSVVRIVAAAADAAVYRDPGAKNKCPMGHISPLAQLNGRRPRPYMHACVHTT